MSLYFCVLERLGSASSVGAQEVLGHYVVIVSELLRVRQISQLGRFPAVKSVLNKFPGQNSET